MLAAIKLEPVAELCVPHMSSNISSVVIATEAGFTYMCSLSSSAITAKPRYVQGRAKLTLLYRLLCYNGLTLPAV